jgi:hypothetical protein
MGALTMNRHDTPSLENTMDTPFDAALRQHFRGDAEPDDDGFSQRVMASLPARASPRRIRYVEMIVYAQWTASSLAAWGAAVLMSISDGRVDVAQSVAAYTLIGLLIFWSIPSRWSRG